MALQKKVKWLFTLIVLANLVIVLVVVLGAFEPPQSKPLPNPNGYDVLVRAGKLVNDNTGDYSTMKAEALAALVATNGEALKLARVGLGRDCRVPDDYSTNFIDNHIAEMATFKKLALNFCAEGRLALLQNRTNDAAQDYLDAEILGLKCCDGGLLITKLVGIACEYLGRGGLQSMLNIVDAPTCRAVAQKLESLDAGENSIADILQREKAFANKTGTFGQKIAAFFMFRQRQKMEANFTAKFQKNQIGRRQLMIDFAARAYELEIGKPPTAAAALVPDYLKAVPKDPATGTELSLRSR